eukprot:3544348-Rhodomonas_salina.1
MARGLHHCRVFLTPSSVAGRCDAGPVIRRRACIIAIFTKLLRPQWNVHDFDVAKLLCGALFLQGNDGVSAVPLQHRLGSREREHHGLHLQGGLHRSRRTPLFSLRRRHVQEREWIGGVHNLPTGHVLGDRIDELRDLPELLIFGSGKRRPDVMQ